MNHLTHFRKITILRFVLAGAILLFSVPALFADGIASRYPNDVGIENDPAVIFADDFESYATPDQIKARWGGGNGSTRMRVATEEGNVFAGNKSVEFFMPVTSTEISCTLWKLLNPTQDTVFMRMYQKFDPGYNIPGGNHNGIRLSAEYPETAGHIPPADGTGFFLFLLQNNVFGRPGEISPGYSHLYAYWPRQRSMWGDHWYSDGAVIPGGQGDWITNPNQYPNFQAMPNFPPRLGRWYAVELMVKANTPGQNNGEIAFWIDGQLKGRLPNLFLRGISSLKLDRAVMASG